VHTTSWLPFLLLGVALFIALGVTGSALGARGSVIGIRRDRFGMDKERLQSALVQ